MNFFEVALMVFITVTAVRYLVDMIRYARGYEVNGKRRYGKSELKGSSQGCPFCDRAA